MNPMMAKPNSAKSESRMKGLVRSAQRSTGTAVDRTMSTPPIVARKFTGGSMLGNQRFDDALHLHSPRAFHEQQVTGNHDTPQELGRCFRRFEKFGLIR